MTSMRAPWNQDRVRRAAAMIAEHAAAQRRAYRWPHLAHRATIKRGRRFVSRSDMRALWRMLNGRRA